MRLHDMGAEDPKPLAGRAGPWIHDLRHSFVVHRMIEWYREDISVQARLPYLWTYLGHASFRYTCVAAEERCPKTSPIDFSETFARNRLIARA
jgi:hypothetical protein